MLRLSNIVIGIAVAIISLSLWAYINRPQQHPGWPKRVMGFAFSPYHADQDPRLHRYPTLSEIEADLKLLSGKASAIRTYSVEDDLAAIPARQDAFSVAARSSASSGMVPTAGGASRIAKQYLLRSQNSYMACCTACTPSSFSSPLW